MAEEQVTQGNESVMDNASASETPAQESQPKQQPAQETKPSTPEVKPEQTIAPPTESTAESTKESSVRVVPDPDGYKLPDGVPTSLGRFAHEQGFTQEQLDATLKTFEQFNQSKSQAEKLALRKLGDAQLKNWGNESKYKLELAKRALRQNDRDGTLTKALKETGYANHPAVLNFLANLGKSMEEGGYLKSAVHRPRGEKTTAQVLFPNHPSNN